MKKIRFNSWVVPALYVVSLSIIFMSMIFVGRVLMSDYDSAVEAGYVPKKIVDDDIIPVVEVTNETVNHPYLLEGVRIAKDFYDPNGTEESQINSLIFYKNTYMENTGVLYTCDSEFDVVSVLDGVVTSITEDEILGMVVEITHTTELITIYHTLNKVLVNVGDEVKQNDVIGTSGKTNIDEGYENALLFEVNYRGRILNPNEFYNMQIKDLIK